VGIDINLWRVKCPRSVAASVVDLCDLVSETHCNGQYVMHLSCNAYQLQSTTSKANNADKHFLFFCAKIASKLCICLTGSIIPW